MESAIFIQLYKDILEQTLVSFRLSSDELDAYRNKIDFNMLLPMFDGTNVSIEDYLVSLDKLLCESTIIDQEVIYTIETIISKLSEEEIENTLKTIKELVLNLKESKIDLNSLSSYYENMSWLMKNLMLDTTSILDDNGEFDFEKIQEATKNPTPLTGIEILNMSVFIDLITKYMSMFEIRKNLLLVINTAIDLKDFNK